MGMDANDMEAPPPSSSPSRAVRASVVWGSATSCAAQNTRGEMRRMLRLSRHQDVQQGHCYREGAPSPASTTLNDGDFVTVIGGNGAGAVHAAQHDAGVYRRSGVIELGFGDITAPQRAPPSTWGCVFPGTMRHRRRHADQQSRTRPGSPSRASAAARLGRHQGRGLSTELRPPWPPAGEPPDARSACLAASARP